jgi:UDP-N-acetylglucosamine--N-acetylmuramyl-(pentapeptide) pyrophosphoryl-undecaprenol N-acetylglucosamine transferase
MSKKRNLIIIAAGGTGGHVFPAQSVAEGLLNNGFQVKIITDSRGYEFFRGFLEKKSDMLTFDIVQTVGLNRGIRNIIKFFFKMIFAILKTYGIFFKNRKKILCVAGFGGYASCPPILVSKLFDVYSFVHQSDIVIGKANKFLFNFANKILLGMRSIDLSFNKKFANKSSFVGIPVREMFLSNNINYDDSINHKIAQKLHILVIGGSQSASIWSKILPESIELLNKEIREKIFITQQCGKLDIELLREKYNRLGVASDLMPFIYEISTVMNSCDIIFCRSGASSIAEAAFLAKPIFTIPYPFAAQNHQVRNAEYVCNNEGGWYIEENNITPQDLSKLIENIFLNRNELVKRGKNLKNLLSSTHDIISIIVEHKKNF